jgi:hypothetical protein
MALANDIRILRDRALAELHAIHDYYADTKIAWGIVDEHIAAGKTFAISNPATGTTTTQADLAVKAQGYITQHLAEATFQQFISTFENFFFDLLGLWLLAYPQNLSQKTVDFKAVLDAPDKDAVISLVVNKVLNEQKYERPVEWFKYLEKLVKLGCPTADEIDRIAEAKASRDVLTHNRGVANKSYESKAGRLARFKEGDRIDIPELYHRETWELLRKVVDDLSNAASVKAP